MPITRTSGADVQVVAAYGKTELSSAALSCPVQDFDSSHMPPSQAYLPISTGFKDQDVREGFISGVITLTLPEVPIQGIVSSYHVLLADLHGDPIEGFGWTAYVHQGTTREVQIHLGTLQAGNL